MLFKRTSFVVFLDVTLYFQRLLNSLSSLLFCFVLQNASHIFKCWLLDQDCALPLALRTKTIWNVDSSDHRFSLCVSPTQMNTSPEESAVFLRSYWSCMAFSLYVRLDFHCVSRCDSDFPKCPYRIIITEWCWFLIHCTIHFFYTVHWGIGWHGHSVLVFDLLLTRTDFSGFFESFEDIMDC